MKNIIKGFKKYTNPKSFRITMIFFFIATFIIDNKWFGQGHLTEVTQGVGMIDMNIINSVSGIYSKLSSMGTIGREIYMNLLILDYLIVFALGVFQIISLLRLVEGARISKRWEYLTILPILRGMFDGIENILLYNATIMFPSQNTLLLKVIAIIIFAKWVTFWLTMAALLWLAAINIYQSNKKRREDGMKNNVTIIGLTASARKQGLGAKLTNHALKGAERLGANVEIIDLYQSNLEFCTGCLKCMESGRCPINDDFEKIKTKMHNADGIIMCAPTYCGTYSAVMKNFIDRLGLYEHLTSSLGNKYILGISTAGNKRMAKQTAKELVGLLTGGTFARGYISGVMGASTIPGNDLIPERKLLKEKSLKEAQVLGEKLVKDIQKQKKYRFQNIFNRLLSTFVLRPMYVKSITKNKDKNTKAVYNNLVSRNLI